MFFKFLAPNRTKIDNKTEQGQRITEPKQDHQQKKLKNFNLKMNIDTHGIVVIRSKKIEPCCEINKIVHVPY